MKCINCNSTLLCRNKLFVLRHYCFAKKNSTPEKFPMPFAVRYANPLVFRHIKKTLSRIIGIRFFYFCRFNFPSKLFCFNSFFRPITAAKIRKSVTVLRRRLSFVVRFRFAPVRRRTFPLFFGHGYVFTRIRGCG